MEKGKLSNIISELFSWQKSESTLLMKYLFHFMTQPLLSKIL